MVSNFDSVKGNQKFEVAFVNLLIDHFESMLSLRKDKNYKTKVFVHWTLIDSFFFIFIFAIELTWAASSPSSSLIKLASHLCLTADCWNFPENPTGNRWKSTITTSLGLILRNRATSCKTGLSSVMRSCAWLIQNCSIENKLSLLFVRWGKISIEHLSCFCKSQP